MKKLLSIMVCFLLTLSLSAEKNIAESKSYVGVWQHIIVQKQKVLYLPMYKVYLPNSAYFTFSCWPSKASKLPFGKATIVSYGTLTQKSDTKILEHIKRNYLVKDFDGVESLTNVKLLQNSDLLAVSYFNKKTREEGHEGWVRVPGLKNSKKKKIKFKKNKSHLVESTTVAGLWRKGLKIKGKDNSVMTVPTGEYKLFTEDGNYLLLITPPNKEMGKQAKITHYGSYKIKSDTVLCEKIKNHIFPQYVNKKSTCHFHLINQDIMSYSWFDIEKERWEEEIWTRVK